MFHLPSVISFLVYLCAILNYCLLIYISDSSVDNREKLKDMQVHAGHFFFKAPSFNLSNESFFFPFFSNTSLIMAASL